MSHHDILEPMTASGVQRSITLPIRRVHLDSTQATTLVCDALASGAEMWVIATGDSMRATIAPGDAVLLAPVRDRMRRGDVLLFRIGRRLVLHRVVQVLDDAVVMRGDAHDVDDPPVARADVIARALVRRRARNLTTLHPTTRFGITPLVRGTVAAIHRRLSRARRVRRGRQVRTPPAPPLNDE